MATTEHEPADSPESAGTPEVAGHLPSANWSESAAAGVVGWTLLRASWAMTRRFTGTLATVGLTGRQLGTLIELAISPGSTGGQLARRIDMTAQAMGEQLRVLTDRGLVERDAPAGRGKPIGNYLTAAGQKVLAEVTPLVHDLNKPDALGLSTAELETLNALLHRLHDRLSR